MVKDLEWMPTVTLTTTQNQSYALYKMHTNQERASDFDLEYENCGDCVVILTYHTQVPLPPVAAMPPPSSLVAADEVAALDPYACTLFA
jgi:hypothetical protein